MDFEKAVSLVSTVTDLRRIASARVIDHNQLKDDELLAALVPPKPQYEAADTVPPELTTELRRALRPKIRSEAYREKFKFWKTRTKAHLTEVLEKNNATFNKYDNVEALVELVLSNVPPSKALGSASPRCGLDGEELSDWCRDLDLSPTGTTDQNGRHA